MLLKICLLLLSILLPVMGGFSSCERTSTELCPSGFGCSICIQKCANNAGCDGGDHGCYHGECIPDKRRFFKKKNATAANALQRLQYVGRNGTRNCTTDEDCKGGFYQCINSVCQYVDVADDQLVCSGLCASGPEKPERECFEKLPKCKFDYECRVNYFCVDERCQRVGHYHSNNDEG